eukprot:5357395-Amphidinium_carterae.1
MVGRALKDTEMERVLCNLGTLQQPWNCPHGRSALSDYIASLVLRCKACAKTKPAIGHIACNTGHVRLHKHVVMAKTRDEKSKDKANSQKNRPAVAVRTCNQPKKMLVPFNSEFRGEVTGAETYIEQEQVDDIEPWL